MSLTAKTLQKLIDAHTADVVRQLAEKYEFDAEEALQSLVVTAAKARTEAVAAGKAEATKQAAQAGEGELKIHDGGAGPVFFPHKKHQTELGLSCNTCHHQGGYTKCRNCHTPGFTVPRKDAFHDAGVNSCRNCHRSKKSQGWDGPLTCTGCHKDN